MRSPLVQVDRTQNRISFRDEGISLSDLLINEEIDEETVKKIIKGWKNIMHALLLLHRARYAHRDIKMSNVVFNPKSGTLGLIDFDLMMSYERLNDLTYQSIYAVWPLETYYYRAVRFNQSSKDDKVFISADDKKNDMR
jgi:serine/threonine protein kinase